MKVVLASNNAGKVREFNALFESLQVENANGSTVQILSQAELNVEEIEETGLTFIENAILKARHASRVTGLPALADDSGLSVDALAGAPGIYSARYAGKHGDAAANIKKLLHELKDVPAAKRGASFHCVLVYMQHADDPTPLVCTGKWTGTILTAPQGEHGFGYDPVFYVASEQKSAAELPLAIKNKISHRGLALDSLLKQFPDKI